MDYANQADTIKTNARSLLDGTKSISSSNFDGIWSGTAHDKLTGTLKETMDAVNAQIDQVNSFVGAVAKLAEYKTCKEKIDENNLKIESLDQEKDKEQIDIINTENSELQTKKDLLKADIESVISSITPYASTGKLVSY